jgi:phosphoribosylaminoimidazole-succinocarboxamide synthase
MCVVLPWLGSSAVVLLRVPLQVLNQTAAWWFANTGHIIGNAVLDVPDPNITVMKKCSVFPVEFVVRGFMTGAAQNNG